MKNRKLFLTIVIGVVFFLCIGIYQMIKSKPERGIYEQWRAQYVTNYQDGAYVNGSDRKTKSKTALSEAQGYGMLITVLAAQNKQADQKAFNRLLVYYQKHTISASNHLMAWKQVQRGQKMVTLKNNRTNATDGDLDIAFALLQADRLWGSSGQYNYRQLAKALLDDILRYNYNSQNELPYVGNWAKSDTKYHDLVRTSDLIPAYFETFYATTQDERWHKLSEKSVQTLQKLSDSSSVGLMPDFIWARSDGISAVSANTFESKNDGDYGWNANRIPMRLAFQSDNAQLKAINRKMLDFFSQQEQIKAVYDLNGQARNDYTSMAFVAPVAVAAYQQKQSFNDYAKGLVRRVKSEKVTGNYYADTLQVLALLMIENNLKLEE